MSIYLKYRSIRETSSRRHQMKQTIIAIILILLSASSWAEPVLIVNPSVADTELKRSDVAKIFLGKKKKWPSGEKVTAILLKDGNVHQQFIKTIVRKTLSQFSIHWKRMVFTGKGQALKTVASEAEMIETIKNAPGAVGYIDSDTLSDDLKTITIR